MTAMAQPQDKTSTEITPGGGEAQANQNISILGNANEPHGAPSAPPEPSEPSEPAGPAAPSWKDDPRFFQTGDKAGQLRPRYRRIGETLPREAAGIDTAPKPGEFDGITAPAVKASSAPLSSAFEAAQEKSTKERKAEKKAIEARVGAKMVMRMLDTLNGFISGNEFGRNFTPEQQKDRMNYREELEKDWQDFLLTLDYSLHPGIVVAFGSMMYVAPAFETPKGKERTAKMKEKFIGKLFSKLLPW